MEKSTKMPLGRRILDRVARIIFDRLAVPADAFTEADYRAYIKASGRKGTPKKRPHLELIK